MKALIPYFVPVPGAEVLRIISIVSLIAGICFAAAGGLRLFLNRRKRREKRDASAWTFICVGVLLIANHGIQLIF